VGFLSAYFRDHTIGRLNLGRIERLPRDRFEVIILAVGRHEDEFARKFAATADKYVVLPRDVAQARRMAADEDLDVLCFTDVGMDALSYTLAFSRMAPIQCATWGHPVTTGSPTMDYFISSALLEMPQAASHYTESLVEPPTLGTYYYRPALDGSPKSRSEFGLPPESRIYLCPQTLFKFHPEFDPYLERVLQSDPQGLVVLIEGRTPNWTETLKSRFDRVMPRVAERIRWLPPQSNQDFLQLLELADVLLDPLHFGGGNTSYEALAMGTPVVTVPGEYLRSRITRALYAKMGLFSSVADAHIGRLLVADSLESYASAAVAIAKSGSDSPVREWIRTNSPRLFEDDAEVQDFSAALTALEPRRPAR
jgi:predicted O-linked N-acetylglucosamine transferase (SPINDLY family)